MEYNDIIEMYRGRNGQRNNRVRMSDIYNFISTVFTEHKYQNLTY